jgi:large repetitive protein
MKPSSRRSSLRSQLGIQMVLIGTLCACGGGGGGSQGVSVSLSGVNPFIAFDQKPIFSAQVSGSTDTSVTWSLLEGSAAGQIDSAGKYTPNFNAGVYHVVATSHADPTRSATAAFQLILPAYIGSFTSSNEVLRPGGTAQLSVDFYGGTGSISGIGPVTAGLPVTVSPTATTIYTFTVQNAAGESLSASLTEIVTNALGAFTTLPNEYPQDLFGHAASLLPSGQVLVTGGTRLTGLVDLATVSAIDPATGLSSSMLALNVARHSHLQIPLDGSRLLVLGGNNYPPVLYDAAGNGGSGQQSTANMPYSVGNSFTRASRLLDGRVFVDMESWTTLYNPVDNTNTDVSQFADARAYPTLTTLKNGKVLIAGGVSTSPSNPATLDTAALFDPGTNTLTPLGSRMSTPRTSHSATLLADGTVLLVGGVNANTYLGTAELFDPSTNSFTTVIPLNYARYVGFTSTPLADGRVLIAGNTTSSNSAAQGICEIYQPSQKTFSATGSLNYPRSNHTATLLSNGKVLVLGGTGAELPNGHSMIELFDPTQ